MSQQSDEAERIGGSSPLPYYFFVLNRKQGTCVYVIQDKELSPALIEISKGMADFRRYGSIMLPRGQMDCKRDWLGVE